MIKQCKQATDSEQVLNDELNPSSEPSAIYRKYSQSLMEKYGEKVYKIPVNLPITCPNRDGCIGMGGCIFCGEVGTGFEAQSATLSVREQLERNIEIISPKYGAKKYIAYFQNYTNTYMPQETFQRVVEESCIEGVVGISISTRPDCISDVHLEILKQIQITKNVAIEIELGLQSININTLKKINRGHGFSEYLSAVLRIQKFDFSICTHLIGNLPWDTEDDFYEAAKILNVLKIDSVKIHSLYILKNTVLGSWYEEQQFEMIGPDVYIQRVIHFLRLLSPKIVVQRLFGRAPEEVTLFCNWGMSWRKLQNNLEAEMKLHAYRQGDLYSQNEAIVVIGGNQ